MIQDPSLLKSRILDFYENGNSYEKGLIRYGLSVTEGCRGLSSEDTVLQLYRSLTPECKDLLLSALIRMNYEQYLHGV